MWICILRHPTAPSVRRPAAPYSGIQPCKSYYRPAVSAAGWTFSTHVRLILLKLHLVETAAVIHFSNPGANNWNHVKPEVHRKLPRLTNNFIWWYIDHDSGAPCCITSSRKHESQWRNNMELPEESWFSARNSLHSPGGEIVILCMEHQWFSKKNSLHQDRHAKESEVEWVIFPTDEDSGLSGCD